MVLSADAGPDAAKSSAVGAVPPSSPSPQLMRGIVAPPQLLPSLVPFDRAVQDRARAAAGACRALTPVRCKKTDCTFTARAARCKHLTVRLQHASRDVVINFIFAARTARCEGRPWYPQRAERAAHYGAVPVARRIIFYKI